MTLKQLRKQQAKCRAEKRRGKRRAKLDRQTAIKSNRKAKRAARAAPKKSLAAWAEEVRAVADFACEVCGRKEGEQKFNPDGTPKLNKNGKPVFVHLNAHHLLEKRYYPEHKTNPLNGICLCPKCHSFGKYSFHKNGIWATLFLKKNASERYTWCRANL